VRRFRPLPSNDYRSHSDSPRGGLGGLGGTFLVFSALVAVLFRRMVEGSSPNQPRSPECRLRRHPRPTLIPMPLQVQMPDGDADKHCSADERRRDEPQDLVLVPPPSTTSPSIAVGRTSASPEHTCERGRRLEFVEELE
jgi:hypothetical protein